MPIDSLFKELGMDLVFLAPKKNLTIHIENSYLIRGKEMIARYLSYIHSSEEYKSFLRAGFNRTPRSQINEWAAHNVLYRLGFQKHRTGSVDINQNEPTWRKILYAILSIFEVKNGI